MKENSITLTLIINNLQESWFKINIGWKVDNEN